MTAIRSASPTQADFLPRSIRSARRRTAGRTAKIITGRRRISETRLLQLIFSEDYQLWGDRLRSFFQPRSWGTVYAYDGGDGRKAAYQVEKIDIEETGTVRDATISLICPDPKFYALTDELTQLAIWQGCIRSTVSARTSMFT